MSDNEENIQDQLYLKQELLKEEIIAKEYDGQKFLEYCVNLKENGDDMNNWTYDELKSVVENFVAEYNSELEKKEEQKRKKQRRKMKIKKKKKIKKYIKKILKQKNLMNQKKKKKKI